MEVYLHFLVIKQFQSCGRWKHINNNKKSNTLQLNLRSRWRHQFSFLWAKISSGKSSNNVPWSFLDFWVLWPKQRLHWSKVEEFSCFVMCSHSQIFVKPRDSWIAYSLTWFSLPKVQTLFHGGLPSNSFSLLAFHFCKGKIKISRFFCREKWFILPSKEEIHFRFKAFTTPSASFVVLYTTFLGRIAIVAKQDFESSSNLNFNVGFKLV